MPCGPDLALEQKKLLSRRDWLAVVFFALIYAVMFYTGNWQVSVRTILLYGLIAMAMTRCGLVAAAVTAFANMALTLFPVTLNFSVWYAGIGLAPLVATLALAVFAF